MSDWREVRLTIKDDWKSITEEFGEQSAMITLTIATLPLSALVLDSGLCCHLFVGYLSSAIPRRASTVSQAHEIHPFTVYLLVTEAYLQVYGTVFHLSLVRSAVL